MSDDNTLTDRSYELVETLERRRKWLTAVVIVCFILVPVGVGIDAHLYMTVAHQKGGWSDMNMVIMAMASVMSGLLLVIGIKKYMLIKDLKKKLGQMELLEETIYNEVISPNLRQLL
jgi:hypothetical protein